MTFRQLPPEHDDEQRRYEPLPVVPRWWRIALVVALAVLVGLALALGCALLVAG